MVLVALGADADVTAVARLGHGAAAPAEARCARPVGKSCRVGDHAQPRGRERDGEVAQPRQLDAVALDGEDRPVGPDAEEDRVAVLVAGLQRERLGVRAGAADDDRPRRGVATRGVQPRAIGAAQPGAIQRAAGEGDGIRGSGRDAGATPTRQRQRRLCRRLRRPR
jgi:hypothetical protein